MGAEVNMARASRASRATPAKAGAQHRRPCNWTRAFAGVEQ